MTAKKWILLVCGLASIGMIGSGCDTLAETMIDSGATAIGKAAGDKQESLYDQMERESDERWQRIAYPYQY